MTFFIFFKVMGIMSKDKLLNSSLYGVFLLNDVPNLFPL